MGLFEIFNSTVQNDESYTYGIYTVYNIMQLKVSRGYLTSKKTYRRHKPAVEQIPIAVTLQNTHFEQPKPKVKLPSIENLKRLSALQKSSQSSQIVKQKIRYYEPSKCALNANLHKTKLTKLIQIKDKSHHIQQIAKERPRCATQIGAVSLDFMVYKGLDKMLGMWRNLYEQDPALTGLLLNL